MTVLVTGAAGFIGMHVSRALLARGERVVGIDNLNDYYDPKLKDARLATLADDPNFVFERVDIAETDAVAEIPRNATRPSTGSCIWRRKPACAIPSRIRWPTRGPT
jgi:nucleoside-diphosphate-sugar epimerase